MKLTINLEEAEVKILRKRAKKNLLDLKEQVEDIVRRSCISYKNPLTVSSKSDDSLIKIFSRDKKGRKRK